MNYTQIKAAVLAWLHNNSAEVAAQVDNFILLAEARLNRDLDARILLKKVTGAFAETIALPSNFSSIISLNRAYSGGIYQIVPPMSFQALRSGGLGYCLADGGLQISSYITGNYELAYLSKLPSLITNTTNTIATEHPDLYIYACLVEACPFTRDEKEMQFLAKYQDILNSVNINEQHLGQSLSMRSDFHGA